MHLIRTGAIEGYETLIRKLGGNPIELLSEVGLSPVQLSNPNTYIEYRKLSDLLEISAAACNQPLLGVLLAQDQSSRALGDIGIFLSLHNSLRESLDTINKYIYLHARGVNLKQRLSGDYLHLELLFDINSTLGLNQLTCLSLMQLSSFTLESLEVEGTGLTIFLRASPNDNDKSLIYPPLKKHIVFNAENNYVQLPLHWLDKPLHQRTDAIASHFQQHITELAQLYPDNLPDTVKEAIQYLLPSSDCSLEKVAATLNLHPRVMQKRLKKEACSYGQLLQEVRLQIAKQHLQYGTLSVTDLALNLGYSDVTVFSRNFKKWTGLSPRQWQQTQK
jgi:AraC-like DNA-binding protein